MNIKKQKGFGLVELMLGLFIGTCLLTLMIRHYLTTKQHSVDTAKVLGKAYDQQFITELIRTSIRQAGFTPCAPIQWLSVNDGLGEPHLEAIALNVGDKQALQISRMSEYFSIINEFVAKDQLLVEADSYLKVNTNVLVADCFHAEVRSIQSIKREGKLWRVSFKDELRYSYTSPVYIGEWLQERFFVGKNKKGENALYYELNHAEELSDEIKGLAVKLESLGVKRLLSIDFFLDQGKTWHIETAVRV